jgi:hypothetical protein
MPKKSELAIKTGSVKRLVGDVKMYQAELAEFSAATGGDEYAVKLAKQQQEEAAAALASARSKLTEARSALSSLIESCSDATEDEVAAAKAMLEKAQTVA